MGGRRESTVTMSLIVLMSDFGVEDNYVGVMKGVMKNINPDADIIDLNHNIEPQNIKQAGFCLSGSYKFFPKGTIFVCVVDPGVGSERKIILLKTKKHYFIAPDNSIISDVVKNEKVEKITWVNNGKYFLTPVSNTFHSRDIFSPVSGWLSLGTDINKFGPAITIENIVKIRYNKPYRRENIC